MSLFSLSFDWVAASCWFTFLDGWTSCFTELLSSFFGWLAVSSLFSCALSATECWLFWFVLDWSIVCTCWLSALPCFEAFNVSSTLSFFNCCVVCESSGCASACCTEVSAAWACCPPMKIVTPVIIDTTPTAYFLMLNLFILLLFVKEITSIRFFPYKEWKNNC